MENLKSKAETGKKKLLTEAEKILNKKISQKKYYEANKIAIMEQHKQYLKNYDKTKKNAYANKWYKNNKDKVALKMKLKKASLTEEDKKLLREKQKIYRQKHKDKISEYRKKNYWKNRDSIRQAQKDYYAKTNQRIRSKTYKKKDKEAIKAKKVNKHLSAIKDRKMLDHYIQNVWNTLKSF